MSHWIKTVFKKIKNINSYIEKYTKDTIIQSLPSVAFVNKAKKLIEENKLDEALSILHEALRLPQKDDMVHKYLGIIYEKKGDFSKAVEYYTVSAQLNYHDKEIWTKLGFAQINCNMYKDAEKSFEAANKITPHNTDVFTGWGMSLMKQNKIEEAKEKFIQASSINKYNVSAILFAAMMEVKLGEYDSADSKLNLLANVSPNTANTYEYAHLKFLKHDYDNAVHYAKKSLEYNKRMLPSYLLLGNIYALRFDEENCEACFETAENEGLESALLYLEWAKALIRLEKYQLALEKINLSEQYSPDDIEIKFCKTLPLYMTGKREEALNLINNELTDTNDNLYITLTKAMNEYDTGDMNNAVTLFRNALNIDSSYVTIYYYLAKCYQALQDNTRTKELYEKADAENPKRFATLLDFAKYYMSLEDYQGAIRKLRRALKLDENNIEVLNLLFFASYILVKENVCEYNIKETLAFADKIEAIAPEMFNCPDKKAELTELLKNFQERE